MGPALRLLPEPTSVERVRAEGGGPAADGLVTSACACRATLPAVTRATAYNSFHDHDWCYPAEGRAILTGPLFSEPMRVETVQANGPASWVLGLVEPQSERFRKVTLTADELKHLTILDARHSFDGDGRLLRLGLQAYALGIAYEIDPYFGLSISRVDPMPHQLEAVYDSLLQLAQVKADKLADPVDRDEHTAENIFWVSKEVRWGYIQGKVVAIEKDGPSIKGVLPKDYAGPALDKQRAA